MGAEVVASDGDLLIRRMLDSPKDYELMVRWRNSPHVRYWWDPDLLPLTPGSAREEYEPDTRPDSVSVACIVELDERPVGFIQYYRWESYAAEAAEVGIPVFDSATWGVDIFIGELDAIGRGLGTRVMQTLCGYLESELGATTTILTTELTNHAAIRCYEKAGFVKSGQVRDLDTRDGERTLNWMMIRRPASLG